MAPGDGRREGIPVNTVNIYGRAPLEMRAVGAVRIFFRAVARIPSDSREIDLTSSSTQRRARRRAAWMGPREGVRVIFAGLRITGLGLLVPADRLCDSARERSARAGRRGRLLQILLLHPQRGRAQGQAVLWAGARRSLEVMFGCVFPPRRSLALRLGLRDVDLIRFSS